MPFVDHVLLETVWPRLGSVPHLLRGKRLLHETLERPLPPDIVRRSKQTFTLPFARWMRADLAPIVREGLDWLAALGWIGFRCAGARLGAWNSGRSHWSRPWGLAVLGHFLGVRSGLQVLPTSP